MKLWIKCRTFFYPSMSDSESFKVTPKLWFLKTDFVSHFETICVVLQLGDFNNLSFWAFRGSAWQLFHIHPGEIMHILTYTTVCVCTKGPLIPLFFLYVLPRACLNTCFNNGSSLATLVDYYLLLYIMLFCVILNQIF